MNTICYSGSSQGIRAYNTCLFSISPEPISNIRMLIYAVYCILIIVHLLYKGVSWNSHLTSTDHVYLCPNRSQRNIIFTTGLHSKRLKDVILLLALYHVCTVCKVEVYHPRRVFKLEACRVCTVCKLLLCLVCHVCKLE